MTLICGGHRCLIVESSTNNERRPVIEFKDFTFRYHSQAEPTLRGINLTVYAGEKVLILGPSGCGKSTLLHCINGLIPFAYKGEIGGSLKVNGIETRELDIFKLSKHVGTVLQDTDAQFVGLTVGEDIAFALENDNVPLEEMRRRVLDAAKLVGMEDHLSSSPFELSGGQKQRTTIAGVLVDNVDILLFDEPLANLDPATAAKAIEIIDELNRTYGKTVVIVEHRLEEVLHRPVDRVVVMSDGKILAEADAHEIVCSELLPSVGLREPLYISALKYAGVEVTVSKRPGYIGTLKLNNEDVGRIRRWFSSIAHITVRSKTSAANAEERKLIRLNEGPASQRGRINPLLKVSGLWFSYEPDRPVLKNLNFEVAEGEMISIVGKNGAGKSTLAKVLCGFVNEDAGEILYRGQSLSSLTIKERAEKIGFVMQNPNQMITKSTVYDELALGLKLRKFPRDIVDERVRRVAELCDLQDYLHWPIGALSYGQKKRLTIGSILVLRPELIILDEPTAGQDFRHYSEIMEFLKRLNAEGVTILLITHDMHLILEYTDRTLVLADGELIADLPPSVILTDPVVAERANLKPTSLYTLASMTGVGEPSAFAHAFVTYDRRTRGERAGKVNIV